VTRTAWRTGSIRTKCAGSVVGHEGLRAPD
jgi:hypothetical protein